MAHADWQVTAQCMCFQVWQTFTPKGFPNFLSSLLWQPWINFVWNRRFIAFESLWVTYLLYILNPKFRWHFSITLLINSLWEYLVGPYFFPLTAHCFLPDFQLQQSYQRPFQKNDWGYVGCRSLTVWVVRFTAFPVLPLSISGMLKPKYQNKNFQAFE